MDEARIRSNKHSFWQALIVALVIFWTGILIGVFFEDSRTSKLEKFYFNSETEIFDLNTESEILRVLDLECTLELEHNIKFADRVFEEAKTLEQYDTSNKITEEIINVHKRYDLLRTMLWKNSIDMQKRCPNSTNIVVYLYQYVEPSINTQATQVTLSKVLVDLKTKYGDKVILIPIAHDANINSLEILKQKYNLKAFPLIFINQEHSISSLVTLKELEKYLRV